MGCQVCTLKPAACCQKWVENTTVNKGQHDTQLRPLPQRPHHMTGLPKWLSSNYAPAALVSDLWNLSMLYWQYCFICNTSYDR